MLRPLYGSIALLTTKELLNRADRLSSRNLLVGPPAVSAWKTDSSHPIAHADEAAVLIIALTGRI